jgi:hypothetical protein
MQILITREQAARIANECDAANAAEVLVTGPGGDLTVALLSDDGTNVATFTVDPGGEIK